MDKQINIPFTSLLAVPRSVGKAPLRPADSFFLCNEARTTGGARQFAGRSTIGQTV